MTEIAEPDPVEALMAALLEASPNPTDAEVDQLVSSHPEHAETLRERFRFLRSVAPGRAYTRLGIYELGEWLGGGGMGVVNRARESSTGRMVAIKQIRREQQWLPAARRRFEREITAIAALSHPGIATVYTVGETDGVPWLAMELIEGPSLAKVLAGLQGRRPADLGPDDMAAPERRSYLDAVISLVLQVAEALAHAHARGVIHRDVKPSNVMLEGSGRARLIDFGLAHVEDASTMTRSGAQPGSLAYMSPEQVRGEPVDGRTDVWSLGVVLYEAATLHSPFLSATEASTRAAILAAAPPPPRVRNARVGRDLSAVLATAMAPERNRRYATMAAFARDLQALLAHEPVAARRPWLLLRLQRWLRRHPVRASAGLALLLLAASPAVLWWRERSANEAIRRQVERAEEAERKSRTDAATAWQIATFLESVFRDATPEYGEARSATLRDALARGIHEIRSGAHADPALRARLLEAMARACLHTGWRTEAIALTAEADALHGELPPPDEPERLRRTWHRSELLHAQARGTEHEAALRAMLASGSTAEPLLCAQARIALGSHLFRRGQWDEARACFRDGLAEMRALLPEDDPRLADPILQHASMLQVAEGREAAEPLVRTATALVDAVPISSPVRFGALAQIIWFREAWGDYEEALRLAEQGIAAAEAGGVAPSHPLRGVLHRLAAKQLHHLDLLGDALRHAERAIALLRGASASADYQLAQALSTASSVYGRIGDPERRRIYANEALQIARALPEPDAALLASAHEECGSAAMRAHDYDAAAAELGAALQAANSAPSLPRSLATKIKAELAKAQLLLGRRDEGTALLTAATAELQSAELPASRGKAQALAQAGWAHSMFGDLDTAESLVRASLSMYEQFGAVDLSGATVAWKFLGWCQFSRRQYTEAAVSLERALAGHRKYLLPSAWFNVLDLLSECMMRTSQYARAEELLVESLALGEPHPGEGNPGTSRRATLARARFLLGRKEEAAADIDAVLDAFAAAGSASLPVAEHALETALRIAKEHPDASQRRPRLERLDAVAAVLLPAGHRLRERIGDALAAH